LHIATSTGERWWAGGPPYPDPSLRAAKRRPGGLLLRNRRFVGAVREPPLRRTGFLSVKSPATPVPMLAMTERERFLRRAGFSTPRPFDGLGAAQARVGARLRTGPTIHSRITKDTKNGSTKTTKKSILGVLCAFFVLSWFLSLAESRIARRSNGFHGNRYTLRY